MESEEMNEEINNEENNIKPKKMSEEEMNKMKKEKAQKAQKLLVSQIRNGDIGKSTELPKISLFNQNEKKILMNVLPEKEIEKFEKRYDALDNAKNNLKRKFILETKSLDKENKDFFFYFTKFLKNILKTKLKLKIFLSKIIFKFINHFFI